MNPEPMLQRLAAAARADAPPPIDVSGRVLADLSTGRARPSPQPWAFASASFVAAVFIAVLAVAKLVHGPDPVDEFVVFAMGMIL